jgi:hypothetical protein
MPRIDKTRSTEGGGHSQPSANFDGEIALGTNQRGGDYRAFSRSVKLPRPRPIPAEVRDVLHR